MNWPIMEGPVFDTQFAEKFKCSLHACFCNIHGVLAIFPGSNQSRISKRISSWHTNSHFRDVGHAHKLISATCSSKCMPIAHRETQPLFHSLSTNFLLRVVMPEAEKVVRLGIRLVLNVSNVCKLLHLQRSHAWARLESPTWKSYVVFRRFPASFGSFGTWSERTHVSSPQSRVEKKELTWHSAITWQVWHVINRKRVMEDDAPVIYGLESQVQWVLLCLQFLRRFTG